LAPRFEIVSLRNADGGPTWRALLLEGEHLGHFRFAAPADASADQARALIHQTASTFDAARSAIAQFRELDLAA
jgi:hypothetical protein